MKKIFGLMGVVGLLFAGCSSEDDILSSFHNDPDAVHITAEVGKASADGFTRSNPLGDAQKQKQFNENDEISVKADGQEAVTYKLVGLEWVPQSGKFLKWEDQTMNFTAYYPASYNGGTITQPTEYTSEKSLAEADFMSYKDKQSNTNGNQLTLTMERKMARVVVEIKGFNNQYASGTEVNSVTINGTVKALKQGKMFYALMVPCDEDNNANFLSLEVGTGNTETLKGIPELVAGKSYTYQLTVGKNKVVVNGITVANWTSGEITGGKAELYAPYVTFTADAEQKFMMTTTGNYDLSDKFQYSVNEGDWKTVEKGKEVTFGGDKGNLRLRGTNAYGTASSWTAFSTITFIEPSVKVACTGDIRTLLDWRNYATVATGQARFCFLFKDCSVLTSAPELPATTLAGSCYDSMFYNCTNLTSAPELSATTLAFDCYHSMFSGCTSLESAPALPAETLTPGCYRYMFYKCTSLTSAPELPATTLAKNCYRNMFMDCTSLGSAPELPATTLADACYNGMFMNCTSLGSAPALPAKKLVEGCYESMFSGCTSLTSAPALPATNLADYCYYSMFMNCTSLKSAPALPADTLANSCYGYMFCGCTKLSSVTMLAPSDQISGKRFTDWLTNAGTDATSRTLTLADDVAYNALVSSLPDNWKKWAAGTTVVYYTPKP